jgi:hypothetical protein
MQYRSYIEITACTYFADELSGSCIFRLVKYSDGSFLTSLVSAKPKMMICTMGIPSSMIMVRLSRQNVEEFFFYK